MRMTTSPRTNNNGISRFLVFTVSSYVSGSISTIVSTSSTSPSTIFKCWSYALERGERREERGERREERGERREERGERREERGGKHGE
jgi:hypothetical protein